MFFRKNDPFFYEQSVLFWTVHSFLKDGPFFFKFILLKKTICSRTVKNRCPTLRFELKCSDIHLSDYKKYLNFCCDYSLGRWQNIFELLLRLFACQTTEIFELVSDNRNIWTYVAIIQKQVTGEFGHWSSNTKFLKWGKRKNKLWNRISLINVEFRLAISGNMLWHKEINTPKLLISSSPVGEQAWKYKIIRYCSTLRWMAGGLRTTCKYLGRSQQTFTQIKKKIFGMF